MLLTGVSARRVAQELRRSLKRAFFWPSLAGVAVAVGLIIMGVRHFYALVSFALCTFVAVTVVIEFFEPSPSAAKKDRISSPPWSN